VIAGHDPLDSTSLPEPSPSLVAHVEDGVAGKRVGVVRELIDGADEEVVAAVERAVEVLKEAGATIVELSVPEFDWSERVLPHRPAEASSNLARFDGVRYGLRVDAEDVTAMMEATRTAGFGDEVKRPHHARHLPLSAGYYDAYYGQALKVRTLTIDAFRRAYQEADVLLGATTRRGLRVRFEDRRPDGDVPLGRLHDSENLSGEPAISIPFGIGEADCRSGAAARPDAARRNSSPGAVLEIADGRPDVARRLGMVSGSRSIRSSRPTPRCSAAAPTPSAPRRTRTSARLFGLPGSLPY